MNTAATKRCRKCERSLPLSDFYACSTSLDGHRGTCKTCKIDQQRRPKPKDPDGLRRCSKCQRASPATSVYFSTRKNGGGGLSRRCRVCVKAKHQEHRLNNPELYRLKDARWREGSHDKYLAKARRWVRGNPHKVKDSMRRWRQANSGRLITDRNRRAARKLDLPDAFSATDWQRAIDYFGGCCAVCGRPPSLHRILAQDHWIPLSLPGCPGTIPANIVPLCHGDEGCNNSKRNHDALEWLVGKLGNDQGGRIFQYITEYLRGCN